MEKLKQNDFTDSWWFILLLIVFIPLLYVIKM